MYGFCGDPNWNDCFPGKTPAILLIAPVFQEKHPRVYLDGVAIDKQLDKY